MGFLQRHMVKHARRYDGALAQVTKVVSATDGDSAERRLHHANKGCCFASIITSLLPATMGEVEVKVEKEETNNGTEGGKKRLADVITLE